MPHLCTCLAARPGLFYPSRGCSHRNTCCMTAGTPLSCCCSCCLGPLPLQLLSGRAFPASPGLQLQYWHEEQSSRPSAAATVARAPSMAQCADLAAADARAILAPAAWAPSCFTKANTAALDRTACKPLSRCCCCLGPLLSLRLLPARPLLCIRGRGHIAGHFSATAAAARACCCPCRCGRRPALPLLDNVEVRVCHRLFAGQALLVVVPQQLVLQMYGVWRSVKGVGGANTRYVDIASGQR